MHQCLRIQEVVVNICDELDEGSALSIALTRKAFLEPALDSLWRHLTSFAPLVACLPRDSLKEVEIKTDRGSRMMCLQRTITASDLQRYLNYYARRIRSFRPHPQPNMTWLSVEALQAIQLATDWQPGVLSPLLKACQMTPPGTRTSWYLNPDFANKLAPCMALFIGSGLKCLEFSSFGDMHLVEVGRRFAQQCFTSAFWHSAG
ncbi:hypothetical protein NMY22_g2646 [Coprinellus aureogranulatus]|nr:hypothetical protein NMY22_g2646 [Coprinellus aureogranulatus]